MNIVYVSYLDPYYSRSSVHLREFVNTDCPDQSISFEKLPMGPLRKIRPLMKFYKKYKKTNPIIVVMSPCSSLVLYLRIMGFRRIVFDGGWPMIDAAALRGRTSIRKLLIWLLDYYSISLSQLYVCESEEQVKNVHARFRIDKRKLAVGFTGFDEYQVSRASSSTEVHLILDTTQPYVFFRGKPNAEAGIETIIETAHLLDGIVHFVLASPGLAIEDYGSNVTVFNQFLSWKEISFLYENSSLVVGQMSREERITRTIPHKFYEAAYFGKAYITSKSTPMCGLVGSGFFECEGDNPAELARTIRHLLANRGLVSQLEEKMKFLYESRFSQRKITSNFRDLLRRHFECIN